MLLAGGLEFGQIYSASSTGDKSMRDAARYLARMPCDSGLAGACTHATAICGWGLTNAKNLAVYGNIAGSGDPLIHGWSTSNVTLQQPSDCTALPNPTIIQLKGTISYTGTLLSAVGLSNAITMHVQHEERYVGD
jgi:hypothetical protein